MKLWIMSDLHIDICPYTPPPVDADLVILAGDIAEGEAALQWVERSLPGRQVLFVAGNHEYYRMTVAEGDALFVQQAAPNVQVLQMREWQQDGVRFLGCTLWTDFLLFGPDKLQAAKLKCARTMADFSCINGTGDARFSVDDSITLHQTHLAWLTAKLDEPYAGKTVVITHHAPTRASLHPKFGDDLVSCGFINTLDHLMGKAALWVHGHTHTPFDYQNNGTRVICNPRGYVSRRGVENQLFDQDLVVEV